MSKAVGHDTVHGAGAAVAMHTIGGNGGNDGSGRQEAVVVSIGGEDPTTVRPTLRNATLSLYPSPLVCHHGGVAGCCVPCHSLFLLAVAPVHLLVHPGHL